MCRCCWRASGRGSFPPCVIVYLDNIPSNLDIPAGVTLHAWMDVVELGRSNPDIPVKMPTNNDELALIMYTSGTTGDPKGVMHSHGSISAGVLIMEKWLLEQYKLQGNDDCYVSYLPMAHILEFGVVNIVLGHGVLVGFGGPRTLTDITARPHGDLTEYKPSLMVGVPRIFDTVRRGVESKLPPPGSLKRKIFDQAFESRLAALREGKDTPFYNEKVFSKPREALGGNIRLFLSGGGPLSAATQNFMNVVFGLMVVGWGLTETVCIGTISRWGDLEAGVTGQVLVAEELKLVDTEDYKHTNKPLPEGELCLRGPFLFKGYYKQDALTKEAIDKDGWFHTGDVGSIDAQGRVRLVGRIKALAKNVLGEYVAFSKWFRIHLQHTLVGVEQLCLCPR
ncbi:long chain fatty acid CoA ligase [Angomonas deanei]|nr:long chain fatty acid CoA ligase [Angomonas deanei]|eukprot:EPY35419.1 long chain fatty acid CoA ligase [Angomonas deanei]